MIKTALIVSGLPRWVELSFPNISKNIIEPNNPDVFIHTWYDTDGGSQDLGKIQNLYKPKDFDIEDQVNWQNSNLILDRMMKGHARSYHRNQFVNMLYTSWYSTQKANQLKEAYRLANDTNYTHVIRCRFDLHFSTPIDCSHFDPNILSVSNKWLPELDMIDDRFGFASEKIMNAYCAGFNLLDIIQEKRERQDGVFCGETLVWEICNMFNIKNQKIVSLTCDNVSHLISQGKL